MSGGGYGSTDLFTLGDAENSFNIISGDNDYIEIQNFEKGFDTIKLSGADDYRIDFSNGMNSIYKITNGSNELIAKVSHPTPLDINANYFTYVYQEF